MRWSSLWRRGEIDGGGGPEGHGGEKGRLTTRMTEDHVGHNVFVRDSIIGFADGLTVPFALTAGLSALGNTKIVVVGGLAELFAGAISMGLGAYLAAVTERKHYEVEEQRGRREIRERPAAKEGEVGRVLEKYGIGREASRCVMEELRASEDMWVRFLMDFRLRLERPTRRMAWMEGVVMGSSYLIGGLLPMIPYFAFAHHVNYALFISIAITGVILLIFGYAKALITGTTQRDAAWGAVQTLLVGALAAAVSYSIVRGVKSTLHQADCG